MGPWRRNHRRARSSLRCHRNGEQVDAEGFGCCQIFGASGGFWEVVVGGGVGNKRVDSVEKGVEGTWCTVVSGSSTCVIRHTWAWRCGCHQRTVCICGNEFFEALGI
eukprot:PhF_6_TR20542/c0_g1_i1/m.29663